MTTINNAVFLSDDEEDESFHGSDVSSEDERLVNLRFKVQFFNQYLKL